MSQRPPTTKARGVCVYYESRSGCRNGDVCKFLHGVGQTISPYDKGKVCKFFTAGFCKFGESCWFRHAGSTSAASVFEPVSSTSQALSAQAADDDDDNICCICQEKPITYGLLTGCSHICCLKCLREWRDPSGKSADIVESGNTKKCPYCRSTSNFVTPSSVFYSSGDPRKASAIEHYKASMARIPCKHFQSSSPQRRFCPFGRDCFYQHKNSDGTNFVFPHGVDYYMKRLQDQIRSRDSRFTDYFPFLRADAEPHDFFRTLTELRTRLESLSLIPSAGRRDDDSDENFISRLVNDVLTSLENAIVNPPDEGQSALTSAPPAPTPSDNASTAALSSLTLTRSVMEMEEFAHEAENHGDIVRDDMLASRFPPWITEDSSDDVHAFSDEEELQVLSALADLFRDAEVPRATARPMVESPSPRPSRPFLDTPSEPLVIMIDSDLEEVPFPESSSPQTSSASHVSPSSRFSTTVQQRNAEHVITHSVADGGDDIEQPAMVVRLARSPPNCMSDPTIAPENRAASPSNGSECQLDDSEMPPKDITAVHEREHNKVEQRTREPRRAKSYSSAVAEPCINRRHGHQSFVTDGRGRVVATDDGPVWDDAASAFWYNPPVAPTTSATGIVAGDDASEVSIE